MAANRALRLGLASLCTALLVPALTNGPAVATPEGTIRVSGTLTPVVADMPTGSDQRWLLDQDERGGVAVVGSSPGGPVLSLSEPAEFTGRLQAGDETATLTSGTVNAIDPPAPPPPGRHRVEIAVVDNLGPLGVTDDQLRASVSNALAYWQREAEGGVVGFDLTEQVTHFNTTLPAGPQACDAGWTTLLDDAVPHFPAAADPNHHLIIVVPPACEAPWSGLGSVGPAGSFSGGFLLAVAQPDMTGVLTHELGHNFGLGHASGLYPRGGPTGVDEYGNPYEVMGMATANATPPALGPVLRQHLDVVDPGEVADVHVPDPTCASTHTYVLNPRSATTGVRSLRLPATPGTPEHLVSFRSGTLNDAGAAYADVTGMGPGTGTGVVLETAHAKAGSLLLGSGWVKTALVLGGPAFRVGPYAVRTLTYGPDNAWAAIEVDYDPGTGCRTGRGPAQWTGADTPDVNVRLHGENRPRLRAVVKKPAGSVVAYTWTDRRRHRAPGQRARRIIGRDAVVPLASVRPDVAQKLLDGDGLFSYKAPHVDVRVVLDQVDSLGRSWKLRLAATAKVKHVAARRQPR